jgi:hypothetical protein
VYDETDISVAELFEYIFYKSILVLFETKQYYAIIIINRNIGVQNLITCFICNLSDAEASEVRAFYEIIRKLLIAICNSQEPH